MQLFNILKNILKSKEYILYTKNKDNTINKFNSNNIDIDFLNIANNDIKNDFISKVGEQNYGQELEKYDNDLFNAYKEADYQLARADYLEAELTYYKTVNDPMSGDANKLYMLYNRVVKLKEKLDSFN